jgi:hypothetical protein
MCNNQDNQQNSTNNNHVNNGWHWSEGHKYALEGIKSLLLLNGAAAIAILAFASNTKLIDGLLIAGIICFGLGSLFSVIAFTTAYKTQLNYGNGVSGKDNLPHTLTYFMVVISIIFFIAGLIFSAFGLNTLLSPTPISSTEFSFKCQATPCHTNIEIK